jgi:hypothetical protein
VLANTHPSAFAVPPTSFVNSNWAGLVFLRPPKSAPERVTLQALELIAPLVVKVTLVFALKSSAKTDVAAKNTTGSITKALLNPAGCAAGINSRRNIENCCDCEAAPLSICAVGEFSWRLVFAVPVVSFAALDLSTPTDNTSAMMKASTTTSA